MQLLQEQQHRIYLKRREIGKLISENGVNTFDMLYEQNNWFILD